MAKKQFTAYACIHDKFNMTPTDQWSIMFFKTKKEAKRWLKHCVPDTRIEKVTLKINRGTK